MSLVPKAAEYILLLLSINSTLIPSVPFLGFHFLSVIERFLSESVESAYPDAPQ